MASNFGLDYPMFPAARLLVVGVGAQNATFAGPPGSFEPATKSGFSNRAEIVAPGALYELGRSGSDGEQRALGYAGTSFSSPLVALFSALDLLRGGPLCGTPSVSRLADFMWPDQPTNGDLPFDSDLMARCL